MISYRLNINPKMAHRLQTFIQSNYFNVRSDCAKSEYWDHHADLLRTNINSNSSAEVAGNAGFYIPLPASYPQRLARKLLFALRHPNDAINWSRGKYNRTFGLPKGMSYRAAFNAVMNHEAVSEPQLSPFRINHLKLAEYSKKVFSSTTALRRHYEAWSGYKLSDNIICHYYYQNILRGFIDEQNIHTILEIGAGNGNFPSIFFHDWEPVRVIIIDLPETLAVAIPYLSNLFPEAKLLLPNEIQEGWIQENNFDFAFLTVDQLQMLPDDCVDMAINCHSFQEMTDRQIDIYFDLIQRACIHGGAFFCANRIEKIPNDTLDYSVARPNRFAEYPWKPTNEVLVHEVSRLIRLVQNDGISIRLERITKK